MVASPYRYRICPREGKSGTFEEQDSVEEHRAAEYIVTALLSQQHRWKDVVFTGEFDPSPTFQDLKLCIMPILTSLKLSLLMEHGFCFDFTSSSRLEQLFRNPLARHERILELSSDLDVAVILGKLTLPSLKFLSAEDTTGECKGDILLNFVQLSMPPLTELHLGGFERSEEQY